MTYIFNSDEYVKWIMDNPELISYYYDTKSICNSERLYTVMTDPAIINLYEQNNNLIVDGD